MILGGRPDRASWVAQLSSMTEGVCGAVPFGADEETRRTYCEGFRDEFGNRRANDRAFLSHVLGVAVSSERDEGEMALDERLWWCVARGETPPEGLLGEEGGLLPDPERYAIEYRTMIELGALQALWWLALRLEDEWLRGRALEAASWHVQELQPDNAINRPWGLAVFVELGVRAGEGSGEALTAGLHAQTLLHNACINFGRPDLLSGLILRDARDQLLRGSQ